MEGAEGIACIRRGIGPRSDGGRVSLGRLERATTCDQAGLEFRVGEPESARKAPPLLPALTWYTSHRSCSATARWPTRGTRPARVSSPWVAASTTWEWAPRATEKALPTAPTAPAAASPSWLSRSVTVGRPGAPSESCQCNHGIGCREGKGTRGGGGVQGAGWSAFAATTSPAEHRLRCLLPSLSVPHAACVE
jgi:hypothetical protein